MTTDSGRRRGVRGRGRREHDSTAPSLLAGKLFDEAGDRLTPSHTAKNQRRHRYYVSNRLISGTPDPSGWRLSAPKLEYQIAHLIADHLDAHAQCMSVCCHSDISALEQVIAAAQNLAIQLSSKTTSALADLVSEVHLKPSEVEISLNAEALASSLATLADRINPDVLRFRKPWQIKRRGVERKIIIGDYKAVPDITLIKLLNRAHGWVEQLTQGIAMKAIADQQEVTPAYIRTRSKIAFLAPKVQEAILGGTLNPEYTANRLVRMKIPTDWAAQESLFLDN